MTATTGSHIHDTVAQLGVTFSRLHHFANFCHDAEETRHFYEDLLGLPLVHTLRAEELPTSKKHQPYVHLFFEMEDKSCLAFFDLLDPPDHPGMTLDKPWTNHMAIKISSMDKLLAAKQRLEEAGVATRGPTDHGFVQSVYFEDPNGVRLELAVDSASPAEMQHERDTAHAKLAAWAQEKARARSK